MNNILLKQNNEIELYSLNINKGKIKKIQCLIDEHYGKGNLKVYECNEFEYIWSRNKEQNKELNTKFEIIDQKIIKGKDIDDSATVITSYYEFKPYWLSNVCEYLLDELLQNETKIEYLNRINELLDKNIDIFDATIIKKILSNCRLKKVWINYDNIKRNMIKELINDNILIGLNSKNDNIFNKTLELPIQLTKKHRN